MRVPLLCALAMLTGACTPASMPVNVIPFEVNGGAPRAAVFAFRLDDASFEKATDVIGDPAILGYPIDARSALRETSLKTIRQAFPGALIESQVFPAVVLRLQDFNVEQHVVVSGAMSHRYTAEAMVTLRVDVIASPGAPPTSASVTGRESKSESGIADRVERAFAPVIEAAIRDAARSALTQAVDEIARRDPRH